MAKEFGWTHTYVLKNLTLSQIQRYCEEANKLKNTELAKVIEGTFYSVAAAFGSMKPDMLNQYLKRLSGSQENVDSNKSIEEMKKQGLPIEDN